MSTKTDGGPAFPVIYEFSESGAEQFGMSLRDWFAGQAKIDTYIDRRIAEHYGGPIPCDEKSVSLFLWNCKVRSAMRYAEADAMIAERERRTK